jgi:hypothetical protein
VEAKDIAATKINFFKRTPYGLLCCFLSFKKCSTQITQGVKNGSLKSGVSKNNND